MKTRPNRLPTSLPLGLACLALAVLLGSGLRESGDLNRFYVALTAIVRRFIERTTGGGLTIDPYMRYLRQKFGEIYDLS